MSLSEIASRLTALEENIVLIYAFNSTGKTRLSVEFKDATKKEDGHHTGVYYNAFSEDLFVWDNDTENNEQNIRLTVLPSSLNKFHGLLTEDSIREKLKMYKPRFDFTFNFHEDSEKGIETISFFIKRDDSSADEANIKISRSEERIFIWCFFLALFEVEGWADQQSEHFFIDDPVSSLDDHNIFVTAATLFDLIDYYFKNRKIIITTHHIGLFSILSDWLMKGEKSDRFKNSTKLFILNRNADNFSLESPRNNVFLYHLHLLQILDKADKEQLYTFHFALLRQVLENVASFLGVGQFGYVLNQIGIEDTEKITRIINTLSHQNVYHYQTEVMNPDNEELFKSVFDKLQDKYNFVLHTEQV